MSRFRNASLIACLCLASTHVAHAGPVERMVQVVQHPSDPDTFLLRYEFGGEGFFLTDDGGETWSLICNTFIDPTTQARRGTATIAGDGALLLGVFDGAWKSDARGCSWALDEGIGVRYVSDFAADPTDAGVIYAASSSGGTGITNGILKREGSGNWSEVGTQDELLITTLNVASTGAGLRFYETAVRGTVTRREGAYVLTLPNYLVRVSDDAGETWQEFPYEAPEDTTFRIEAVDPSNPDRLLAYIDRDETSGTADTVLVSLDGGATFSEYIKELSDFGGVAIAPDGRVFIGDRGVLLANRDQGLWSAPNLAEAPTQLTSEYPVSCLSYQASTDTLFGCDLRGFGKINPETGELSSLMQFNEVQSLNRCPGVDMAATCKVQLCRDYCLLGHFPRTPLCEVYQEEGCGPCSDAPPGPGCRLEAAGGKSADGGQAASDGGRPRAAIDAGKKPEPDDDSGCAVSRPGRGTRAEALALLALGMCGVLGRRRSRR